MGKPTAKSSEKLKWTSLTVSRGHGSDTNRYFRLVGLSDGARASLLQQAYQLWTFCCYSSFRAAIVRSHLQEAAESLMVEVASR